MDKSAESTKPKFLNRREVLKGALIIGGGLFTTSLLSNEASAQSPETNPYTVALNRLEQERIVAVENRIKTMIIDPNQFEAVTETYTEPGRPNFGIQHNSLFENAAKEGRLNVQAVKLQVDRPGIMINNHEWGAGDQLNIIQPKLLQAEDGRFYIESAGFGSDTNWLLQLDDGQTHRDLLLKVGPAPARTSSGKSSEGEKTNNPQPDLKVPEGEEGPFIPVAP